MANGKQGPEGFGTTIGVQITKETSKAYGRAGADVANKKKRDKKLLKDCLEVLLAQKIDTKDGKRITGAEAMSAALFKKALSGDTKAFEILRDTVGQKPVERVEQMNTNITVDFGDLDEHND